MENPQSISIHALRVEGDLSGLERAGDELQFLSTPSGWRATLGKVYYALATPIISIHALRVEGDAFCFCGKPVES